MILNNIHLLLQILRYMLIQTLRGLLTLMLCLWLRAILGEVEATFLGVLIFLLGWFCDIIWGEYLICGFILNVNIAGPIYSTYIVGNHADKNIKKSSNRTIKYTPTNPNPPLFITKHRKPTLLFLLTHNRIPNTPIRYWILNRIQYIFRKWSRPS